jgi:hypothetical protein
MFSQVQPDNWRPAGSSRGVGTPHTSLFQRPTDVVICASHRGQRISHRILSSVAFPSAWIARSISMTHEKLHARPFGAVSAKHIPPAEK